MKRHSQTWFLQLFAACCVSLCLCGCAGYQLGNGSLYRPDIRTVYVPMFEVEGFRRNLGERLTEAVVKEIDLKTPYKVVNSANADSILTGRIISDTKRVLAENTNGEPRDIETGMTVRIGWVDRQGDLLRRPDGIPVPPETLQIIQTASLVPEGGQSVATASQEAIDRLARQIVARMEMPW